ncbi:hypothetical protein PTMSG1_00408 [Pyrenophora teres f. maculata]|nr:hypothetical protein PTMSG1_00408 [Pyrenophora teres f. maculata]
MARDKPRTAQRAALITARNMTESPFLRLPAELRNMIYEFAVAGHIILIETELMTTKRLRNGLFTARAHKPDEKINGRWASDGKRVYPLFAFDLVCRQIRAETSLLQYRTNYFHFDTHEDLEFFSTQLTSTQLHAITDISIDYSKHSERLYSGLCRGVRVPSMLHMFPRLRRLYIAPRTLRHGYSIQMFLTVIRLFLPSFEPQVTLLEAVKRLHLCGQECMGLRLESFDVFDDNAVLNTKESIICTSDNAGQVKWVHADTLVPDRKK